MGRSIHWGIIGCGDVAEVKSGPAFHLVANSSLINVTQHNGSKAKDFAERHQVPHWTDTAQDIIENKDIDAVYIATRPSSKLSYTLAALAVDKHAYLEKPMAMDIAEAQQIYDAVALYRRKLPAFLKVKELLENKPVGSTTLADIKILQP